MQQTLLFLWLVGAALYAVITLTSAPSPTASVGADDFKRPGSESPVAQPSTAHEPKPDLRARAASQTSNKEMSEPATLDVTVPPVDPVHRLWGELLRGAPVHSSPSVSSATLGYAAAGTEMQILERELGWVRVLDPATSREGWIYEEHVTAKESPNRLQAEATARQEAALASEPEKPERAAKSKKPPKSYVSKHRKKKYGRRRFVGLFRRF